MTLRSDAADRLKSYLERIERLALERKELGDEQRAVFAEAKADGFDTKAMRAMVKRRDKDPHELAAEETILDTYMAAVGMIPKVPLHEAVAAMTGDALSRDGLIAAFQELVPINGEIIAKLGGAPVRIHRDEAGKAWVAEYVEPKPAPAEKVGKGLKKSAAVLSIVPKDPVKNAADRAERRSRGKPVEPDDETDDETVDEDEPA